LVRSVTGSGIEMPTLAPLRNPQPAALLRARWALSFPGGPARDKTMPTQTGGDIDTAHGHRSNAHTALLASAWATSPLKDGIARWARVIRHVRERRWGR
jgi:hypothetical protein